VSGEALGSTLPSCTILRLIFLSNKIQSCCPAVPGSNPASPQPTADCQSTGGLPPRDGTWLRADLCEGQQRKKLRKWTAGSPKTYKEKKKKFNPTVRPMISRGVGA
jgi:hypothetical protein